jgi:hypothetical protein
VVLRASDENTLETGALQIHLVGSEIERFLTARYYDIRLPRNMPRILTSNDIHRCIDINDPAIDRRIHVIDLGDEPLFTA